MEHTIPKISRTIRKPGEKQKVATKKQKANFFKCTAKSIPTKSKYKDVVWGF